MSLTIARTIDDAVEAMAAGARPIAGGSDLVVAARQGTSRLPDRLVAIDRIAELGRIDVEPGRCVVGAAVTHAELMTDEAIVAGYTALADAAALVGSPATRHVGTLGGNIMNASPAMDTGAPLIVLGAEVELVSEQGSRHVPIGELWTGPGRTSAAADELCTRIVLAPRAERAGSAYVRLEYRRAMEIAIVGAAASVQLGVDGAVVDAAVALTAVAPTIVTVPGVDGIIAGTQGAEAAGAIAYAAADHASPISDVRASDGYRRHTVGVMARRAFEAAVARARGDAVAVPVNRAIGVGA